MKNTFLRNLPQKMQCISGYRNILANKLQQKRHKMTIPFLQQSAKELAQNLLSEKQYDGGYSQAKADKFAALLKHPEGKLTKKLSVTAAEVLINGGYSELMLDNMDKFVGAPRHVILMDKLIHGGFGAFVAANIQKFLGVNQDRVIKKLIQVHKGHYAGMYLANFNDGLLESTADALAKDGEIRQIIQNPNKFQSVSPSVKKAAIEELKNTIDLSVRFPQEMFLSVAKLTGEQFVLNHWNDARESKYKKSKPEIGKALDENGFPRLAQIFTPHKHVA